MVSLSSYCCPDPFKYSPHKIHAYQGSLKQSDHSRLLASIRDWFNVEHYVLLSLSNSQKVKTPLAGIFTLPLHYIEQTWKIDIG